MQVALALNRSHTRLASLSDLSAICAIEDDSFRTPYPPSLLERLLKDCSESFLVALDNEGTLAGYCVFSLAENSAHLISIAVHRRLRRKGVASTLLQRAFEYLISHNVDEFWLEVGGNNLEALSLYDKLGFERTATLKGYYSDGLDAVRMRLFLRSAGAKPH
jgi:ribosomal-protein-alanine N-acetyltransferase